MVQCPTTGQTGQIINKRHPPRFLRQPGQNHTRRRQITELDETRPHNGRHRNGNDRGGKAGFKRPMQRKQNTDRNNRQNQGRLRHVGHETSGIDQPVIKYLIKRRANIGLASQHQHDKKLQSQHQHPGNATRIKHPAFLGKTEHQQIDRDQIKRRNAHEGKAIGGKTATIPHQQPVTDQKQDHDENRPTAVKPPPDCTAKHRKDERPVSHKPRQFTRNQSG